MVLGEKYREQQLFQQLPRQDLSVAYCKHLDTVAERKAFQDFLNIRNETCLLYTSDAADD